MNKKHLIIQLLPDRLDVQAYEGGCRVADQRLTFVEPDDAAQWPDAVRNCASDLRAVVRKLNAVGQQATVYYRSPTQVIDFSAFPVRWSAQALEAGKLACLDSLPYPEGVALCESVVVGRSDGDKSQTIVAVAAEHEPNARAIADLVEQAQLKLVSATPLDAAVAVDLVRGMLTDRPIPEAVLYIGEHSSFFCIAGGGTLTFARHINMGMHSFIKSLTGDIRPSPNAQTLHLDPPTAHKIFEQWGFPAPNDLVCQSPRLTGQHIIPLLQPVLQHYVVELRQSLRFGVVEKDRTGLTLRVVGPGSRVHGLAKLIQEQLGLCSPNDESNALLTALAEASTAKANPSATSTGRLAQQLNLLPRELARQHRMRRYRRWLWSGTAAAMFFIGVDAVRYHGQLDDARQEAATSAAQIAESRALDDISQKLQTQLATMRTLDQTIHRQLDRRTDYFACLQELSRLTPDGIRFDSVTFQTSSDNITVTLIGYAFVQDGRTDIQPFIESLRQSPLASDVQLGSIYQQLIDKRPAERFETTFVAVPIPRPESSTGQLAETIQEPAP